MDNIEKYYKDKLKISDDEREELFQDFLKSEKEINELFSKKTGLNKSDFSFLFFAVALQVTRQFLLTGDLGSTFKLDERVKDNDKSIKNEIEAQQENYKKKNYSPDGKDGWKTKKSQKGYRTWLEIAMTKKVPYDVTKAPMSLLELFQMGYESISEEWQRLPAAIFAQGLHLKSDEFTKLGLPIPVIGTFSEELALKIYKQNYDYLTLIKDIKIIGKQASFSALINYIIATVHRFFYDLNKDEDEKLYEVKTRKILLYSNIIASTSNIIYTSFTGINNLDLGGLLVTLYRIVSDVSYITKIKKEFIEVELNKKYQGQIDELDKEINQILEKLHFKNLK